MFFAARLIGVSVYAIVAIIAYILLRKVKNTRTVLFVYVLALAIMAFNYKPYITADLYRLYDQLDYFGSLKASDFAKIVTSTNTPTFLVYCRIIYAFGVKELLPAITAALFYWNIFYIIYKSASKFQLSYVQIALLVFFEMSFGQYIQVISGIRSMLVFSFFARCIYNEFFEDKPFFKNIIIYIVFALMHVVGVVTLSIRVLYELFSSAAASKHRFLQIITGVVVIAFGLKYGQTYLQSAADAATGYLTNNSYSYFWEYLLTAVHLFLIVYVVFKNKRCIISSGYVRFYNFWKVFLILIIICCREYSTFQRFSVFLSMLSLPLIACIFGSYKDEKAKSASIHNFLLLGSVVCLMIACTRGNLCALKFA